ncbi:TPR_REGION domain-containing protein [Pseudozyma hubeiensis]|nr:TPR_REGION domain-containing protein [Pseudozyma hubeiensis]
MQKPRPRESPLQHYELHVLAIQRAVGETGMLGGPRRAAEAGRWALRIGSSKSYSGSSVSIEALPPSFLCPAIETLTLKPNTTTTAAGPSSSSSVSRHGSPSKRAARCSLTHGYVATEPSPLASRFQLTRAYSSQAANNTAVDVRLVHHTPQGAQSDWTLSVPDDYLLRHELFLILDSLDGISQSKSDPDCADLLSETLRQAREHIWSNSLGRSQDRDVALYLAGKVAEVYIKIDAEDSMDRLMSFLDYVHSQIGVLPLSCFHTLAAQAGIARRYDAALKICEVAQSHHGGKADAELLHLRLRALIAQSKDVDLTRYWDFFERSKCAVPRKTFDLLLRTHVRRQDLEQLNHVLDAMPQHGYTVDAKAWLTILRGFQSFRPTLATMLRRDANIVQCPTLHVVNQLLLLLSKELDVDGALMVLRIFRIPSIQQRGGTADDPTQQEEMSIIKGPSLQPNVQTYAVLAHMFGRLGRWQETLDFFRLAMSVSDSHRGNDATLDHLQQSASSVMRAYFNAGRPIRAMSFAHEVLKLPYFGSGEGKGAPSVDFDLPASPRCKMPPTTFHYRILLECASAIGSADCARRILVDLLQHGHTIDQQVLRGLARLVFSTIDQDAFESIRVIRRLLSNPCEKHGTERSQRLGSLSDLVRYLGASERAVLESQNAKNIERSANATLTRPELQRPSLHDGRGTLPKDELRDWLIKDSSPLLTTTLTVHNAVDDASSALTQDLSRPLSYEAYAMRIRVYAVVRRDYESAQKVYHAMLSHGVKPTMMHIAPLIEGLIAVGKLDEAQRLKRNAREVTSLEPTLRIHTALIRAYVRAGDFDAARKEIKELTSNGFEMDDTIANIIEAAQSGRRNFALVDRPVNEKDSHSVATRFHSLMRMGRYLAAQEMLQVALDAGMRSDKVLHDLVRRSVGYVQKEHAKALATSPAPTQVGRGKRHRKSKGAKLGIGSHVFELAQALRLARTNRERITKSMAKHSEIKRKQLKEHRKKVVSLVLDFADGKLHQQAALSPSGKA